MRGLFGLVVASTCACAGFAAPSSSEDSPSSQPDGVLVLGVVSRHGGLTTERAVVADARTGATRARRLEGGALCHGPVLAVGRRVIASGSRRGRPAVLSFPLNLTGRPQLVARAEQFVPPSAPGRLWVARTRRHQRYLKFESLREVTPRGAHRVSRARPAEMELRARISRGPPDLRARKRHRGVGSTHRQSGSPTPRRVGCRDARFSSGVVRRGLPGRSCIGADDGRARPPAAVSHEALRNLRCLFPRRSAARGVGYAARPQPRCRCRSRDARLAAGPWCAAARIPSARLVPFRAVAVLHGRRTTAARLAPGLAERRAAADPTARLGRVHRCGSDELSLQAPREDLQSEPHDEPSPNAVTITRRAPPRSRCSQR